MRRVTKPVIIEPPTGEPRKFYFDGGQVEIVAHLVYELDPERQTASRRQDTRTIAAESVRTHVPDSARAARNDGRDADTAGEIIAGLKERGIDFEQLAEQAGQPDADPFDLLCHLAFNAPLRTRRERAQRLKTERKDFFEQILSRGASDPR